MKKILITGNSGYIGSHLTQMLSTDYQIHGLDIKPPQHNVSHHWFNDICDLSSIHTEYHTVIHLAALVNVNESEHDAIRYYNTNIQGTLKVLANTKYKNFIFASTGAAAQCASAYGVSKRAAEDCVRQQCQGKSEWTIFQFYNVIGSAGFAPTNPDGLMYNLHKSQHTGKFTIFGSDYDTPDGTCVRDYVHVMEICHAIKMAIEQPSGKIESLGHGVGRSVKDIVQTFQDVNGIKLDISYADRRPGDLAHSVLADLSPYMKNLYAIQQLLKLG